MTIRIPNASEEAHLERIFDADMEVVLFQNDVEDGLTPEQVNALVWVDFTEADFSGYVRFGLTGFSGTEDWVITGGSPSVATASEATFASDDDQTPQGIYGFALLRASDDHLELYQYFLEPIVIENNGDQIRVTVRFEYQDQGDE
jgi:hypothetical protein